jgi:hypothetical protein
LLLVLIGVARADNAAFDLIGPKIDVRVQRAGVTLPIAEVPALQAGDRLWVHPDLPDSQSVRYLMVVVFLRGATNPPPDSWFTRVETWGKPVHDEGIFVTVPCVPRSGESPALLCAHRRIWCRPVSTAPVWKDISMPFARFPPAIRSN